MKKVGIKTILSFKWIQRILEFLNLFNRSLHELFLSSSDPGKSAIQEMQCPGASLTGCDEDSKGSP